MNVSASHGVKCEHAVMCDGALSGGVYPDMAWRWSASSVALRSYLNSNVFYLRWHGVGEFVVERALQL